MQVKLKRGRDVEEVDDGESDEGEEKDTENSDNPPAKRLRAE